MESKPTILSIDQGTTSSRAMVFDESFTIVASDQQEFAQHFPHDGWVEHDAEEIWRTVVDTCRTAISNLDCKIAAIGITNQRETTIVWDRQTGKPVYNAIVWQDRRTADWCSSLKKQGLESTISSKTGLLLDPYFSASKIRWILENIDGARAKAENGDLAFGTVDTYLIWKLTQGHVHATDATNASRTSLYNIHNGNWDGELLDIFEIPESLLPTVKNCADDFGVADETILGESIAIAGVAGDQQAALVGQACFKPGMAKSTFGTGCFMVMNTGGIPMESSNKLLTTIGYQFNNSVSYALEGSIFNAGTTVQWLRDGLGIIENSSDVNDLINETESNHGVYLVPAFTGLGAPHWEPHARGLLYGLTRDSDRSQLVRAALESVCYQTLDLIDAMSSDSNINVEEIRVDGGMTVNPWFLQFLSDITRSRIRRPVVTETTALGAAYLAAIQVGTMESIDSIENRWQQDAEFQCEMDEVTRQRNIHGWKDALARCLKS